ncbi:MAG: T9SS type A sorting domain-containing protein [Bacteroidetes bacterium]|nr:MAG: T9SS type A sorting domain-containing protein [Bacteroidota bacterium]
MKKLITLLILLVPLVTVKTNVKAAILNAVVSGNWNDPLTWDSGATPICGDTVYVPGVFTVRVDQNVNLNDPLDALCPLVRITIAGRLVYNRGAKIRLAEGACVTVDWGGVVIPSLKGGGASEAIRIGNVNWWQSSDGPLNGLATMGCSVLLPITLNDFMVEKLDGALVLKWVMSSEENVDYYLVEKSTDGANWMEVKMVFRRMEDTGINDYACVDETQMSEGLQYYRLVSVTFDGDSKVLETEAWNEKLEVAQGEVLVAPNPASANGNVTFVFDMNGAREIELSIYNQMGQLIKTETVSLGAQQRTYTVSGQEFKSGQYFVSVSDERTKLNGRMIIL